MLRGTKILIIFMHQKSYDDVLHYYSTQYCDAITLSNLSTQSNHKELIFEISIIVNIYIHLNSNNMLR